MARDTVGRIIIHFLTVDEVALGMNTRSKCIIVLLVLTLLELGAIPVTSAIGLFIVIFRPLWFKTLVEKVYAEKGFAN